MNLAREQVNVILDHIEPVLLLLIGQQSNPPRLYRLAALGEGAGVGGRAAHHGRL
jgi:hypothetical protein